MARIFAAKGRPPTNPLIVHLADLSQVELVAADWPEPAKLLAGRFWPGPLTLVLHRKPTLPSIVTAGGPTVAVRVPAHPVALALLKEAAVPIAAPSANRSARLSPTTAAHVRGDLEGRIDLILDAGPTAGGLESTVLDITCTPCRLLRPGPIAPAELEAYIGPIERTTRTAEPLTGIPRSPGMLSRHYAPRAPLECVAGNGNMRVDECCAQGIRVGWLTFAAAPRPPAGATIMIMPLRPDEYAARLYAALHELDDAGVERIIVELPPDTEAWLAVRDRLLRASARC